MNAYMWAYLNNKLKSKQLDEFKYIFGDNKDIHKKGVLYYKLYSRSIKGVGPLCKDLENTLKLMKSNKMIVAHVPQSKGITHDCNKTIFKTNVAMSEAFGPRFKKQGRIPQVLEILDGKRFNIILSKHEIQNAINAKQPYITNIFNNKYLAL